MATQNLITSSELMSVGFLPRGLYEKLIGSCALWFQETFAVPIDWKTIPIYGNTAIFTYGSQSFKLVLCESINCIQLDIDGYPLFLLERVKQQLCSIIKQHMRLLNVVEIVQYAISGSAKTPASFVYIPLSTVRTYTTKNIALLVTGHPRIDCTLLKSVCNCWLLNSFQALDKYDVFLSYRRNEHGFDSSLVH
jgi:hypothetical protein